MSETLKERSELNSHDMWDLSSLFKSDEKWQEAFDSLDAYVAKLTAYKGTLNNAGNIASFLKERTEIVQKYSDVFAYANLRHSEDTRNAEATGMYARSYSKFVTLEAACSFAEPEILSLSEEELDAIVEDPQLTDYRFLMKDLIRQKAHTLTTGEEEILAKLQEALSSSGEAANNLMDADLKFAPAMDSEGNAHEVTGSSYIPLQMSNDRTLRKNAMQSLYAGYGGHIHTFASTYAGTVKAAAAEADIRHYASSREMHMSGDNIPVSVYDSLIEAVHEGMPLMYRYVKLRKRLLKIDELHYYDVYAPLTGGVTRKYTYEEAQQMVLDAVKPLGEEYVNRVQKAYDERWIDVYPNVGKTGGAFSSGTYDSNPVILLNFSGELDSVSTLAHEMGHSQHTWLTNHTQPAQYSDYSLFVAEVASTVNENLLIEQLLKEEQDPKTRLALLNQYLEGFKGTVYRQTMFAEFEKITHEMAENGESLDADSLSTVYKDLIHLYFGDDLVIDDEVQYEWARIPHFYRPFYVYVYATGYSTAVALSEGILNEGKPAVDRYLEFLSMGSSQYPLDELKHAGVDLTTPQPIQRALKKFEQVLTDAENTAEKLG